MPDVTVPAPHRDSDTADADLAASLLAIDPGLGGALLRTNDTAACEAWLRTLRARRGGEVAVRRLPLGITDDRLIGGIDLAASLALGRRVASPGVLAAAHGGIVVIPLAERARADVVSHVAAALDWGAITVEREGVTRRDSAEITVIAVVPPDPDEHEADAHGAWRDRLAFEIRPERASDDPRGDPCTPVGRIANQSR